MRVRAIRWETYALPRLHRLRLARGTRARAENVVVRIRAVGFEGWGSAAPSDVTRETVGTIQRSFELLRRRLVGTTAERPEEFFTHLGPVRRGSSAARAALDMAFWDLWGKAERRPLYRLLGARRTLMLTDRTVGIEPLERTVALAQEHVAQGFRALKLKCGLEAREDLRRIAAVREAVGDRIALRIDANQGLSVRRALAFAEGLEPLGVQFLEQPIPAEDLRGLRSLRRRSAIPIMADEAVHGPEDLRRLINMGAAGLVNIKLMKCGGITPALQMQALCQEAGLGAMAGCMGEIALSIAAGLHFALASESVQFCDLDSHFNLANDPSSGLGFEGGFLLASRKPGLGMQLRGPRRSGTKG